MFFELRQYRCRPGKRDEWVTFMENEIIPYQIKCGMVVLASFVAPEDPDLYVWLRRFDSEEQRKALYEETYQNDTWQNEFSPRVEELIFRDQLQVTVLEATPRSVIQ